MRVLFITGGARSGKSAYALSQAQLLPGKKAFIATAQALDDEMSARIEAHKRQRDLVWNTYEEPIMVAGLVEKLKYKYDVVLIDCLTVWLSNVMHAGLDVTHEMERLIAAIGLTPKDNSKSVTSPTPTIFIVSNEIGMGIVPENSLARDFRDYQGMLNQLIAGIANEVYLMVAGIPVRVK